MTDYEYYSKIEVLIEQMQKNTKKIPMPNRNIVSNEMKQLLEKTVALKKKSAMTIDELQVVLVKAGGAVVGLIVMFWIRAIILGKGYSK